MLPVDPLDISRLVILEGKLATHTLFLWHLLDSTCTLLWWLCCHTLQTWLFARRKSEHCFIYTGLRERERESCLFWHPVLWACGNSGQLVSMHVTDPKLIVELFGNICEQVSVLFIPSCNFCGTWVVFIFYVLPDMLSKFCKNLVGSNSIFTKWAKLPYTCCHIGALTSFFPILREKGSQPWETNCYLSPALATQYW